MTGLETILSQINNDARQEADELLASAKEKAGAILAFSKEEADKKTQDILENGEKKAQDIRERAASAAELARRNAMLAFTQQMIRDTIDNTRTSLEASPDNEYFAMLLRLAARFAGEGKGEMRLNRRDLERLPEGFETQLKQAVPQAEITISKTPCDIENGFLLVYGGIDINCTFRAIFEEADGELRDIARKILFPAAR